MSQLICLDVATTHTRLKSCKSHQVYELGASLQPSTRSHLAIQCPKHHEEIKLMCVQDDCLVCLLCLATDHHGHKCVTLEEAYQQLSAEVDKTVNSVQGELVRLKGALDENQAMEQRSQTAIGHVKHQIVDFFQQVKLASIWIDLD